ncbi:Slp family lipoprotein [Arenimonas sp. MALMAid1274]|uniref:Slp family lipoprotein n=1 Tax=Arenimonas sp. MALMAid1274 TaxID=3411630 RepID=UPI003B9FD64A
MKTFLALSALLCLAGCVTAPKALQGEYADLGPGQAAKAGAAGERVRWGGRIVKVEPLATQSCFEVVGVRLAADGRPLARDHSQGRFLACRSGFYEPEIFQPGREVTLTGVIEGFEQRKVGDYDYRYPRLAADVVYLWPERRQVDVIVERAPFYW